MCQNRRVGVLYAGGSLGKVRTVFSEQYGRIYQDSMYRRRLDGWVDECLTSHESPARRVAIRGFGFRIPSLVYISIHCNLKRKRGPTGDAHGRLKQALDRTPRPSPEFGAREFLVVLRD